MAVKKLNKDIPHVVHALNDLYVIRRNQYLKQINGGTYLTLKAGRQVTTATGAKFNQRPLVDTMLAEHINGKGTYGVFATDKTKFMVFDLDFKNDWNACKWHYYRIRQAILDCGISEEHIYTTFSGSKGLHVELFFTQAIPVTTAQAFYQYVLQVAGLTEMASNIEYRPTATQGVKLPLGVHHVTNKRCTFVDPLNIEQALPLEHVLTVQKIDTAYFITVMEQLADTYGTPAQEFTAEQAQGIVEQAQEQLFSRTKLLQIYGLGSNADYTAEYYNRLLSNGLKVQGTRHKITYQLALYLKTAYGMDRGQALETLLAWLNEQPANTYTTPLDTAILDTREIIADVYGNNRVLRLTEKELTVTVKELHTVLTATKADGKAFTPKQKTVLFALLMHSKRYATANGTFFMTYAQIQEATGMANRSEVKKLIEGFAEVGLTAIHRSNERQAGTYKHLPNVYSVPFANKNTATNSTPHTENNGISTVKDYTADTFNSLIRTHFTAKELRKLLPRKQAQTFIA